MGGPCLLLAFLAAEHDNATSSTPFQRFIVLSVPGVTLLAAIAVEMNDGVVLLHVSHEGQKMRPVDDLCVPWAGAWTRTVYTDGPG